MKHLLRLFILFFLFGITVMCEKDEVIPNPDAIYGTPLVYDGKTYKTVHIGEQVWMAENLAYLPKVSPPSDGSYREPYYYVYGYDGSNTIKAKDISRYDTYGVLYNWQAALTACPSGWHLPTYNEWEQLAQYVSDQKGPYTHYGSGYEQLWYDVAKHLKAINGTDDFGFFGLLSGCRTFSRFSSIGNHGYWWSNTEYNDVYAMGMLLGYDYQSFKIDYIGKEYGCSVRCVKD